MVIYFFVCPFPSYSQDVDSADRWREVAGDRLDVVEQFRKILYDGNPNNTNNHHKNDKQSEEQHKKFFLNSD